MPYYGLEAMKNMAKESPIMETHTLKTTYRNIRSIKRSLRYILLLGNSVMDIFQE